MACSLLPCLRKLWMNLNSMHETRSKLQVQNDFFFPHAFGVNGHRKRILSRILSREMFENDGVSVVNVWMHKIGVFRIR